MKRTNVILLLVLLFIISIHSISNANQIIFRRENTERISTGTYLTKYELLTEDGWVIANVLKVDISDDYNSIEVMTSEDGVHKLSSTMAMATAKNAIAGINADFFAGSKGIGHSIGIAINNNDIISLMAEENTNNTSKKYSTLFIDKDDEVYLDFFTGNISLFLDDKEIKVNCLNKYSSYLDTPAIYTSAWGEQSIGSTDELYVTEVVVEDGEVVEVRKNKEATNIPENGFVITATGSGAELLQQLRVGDEVYYKIDYLPDLEKIKFAISGGAILIENGEIPEEFSHNVSGRNPRTAIGIDKNENVFYLITVDGRIKSSIGMTQLEFAEFLKSIDVYSAINLDGGGSTTMVAKKLGNTELSEINTPSGGTERLVANGVSVISSAPDSSKLFGIEVKMEETNIFQGERRKVKAIGYNQYYNAIPLDEDEIEWNYKGVDLEFTESGEVTGNTVGEATIIAKVGKIKGELEINILSQVNEIFITPKTIAVVPEAKVNYILQSKNKNGYYAGTNDDTYILKIESYYKDGILQDYIPEDAIFEDLSFSATTTGTYILSFEKGFCTSYAKVDVGIQEFHMLDDFEEKSFYFDPYPDEVSGDAIHSDVQAHSGKYSAKLEYDFDRDAKIRGAYIVLNEPLIIPKEASKLSFWIYNDAEKDEKLKVKAIDGNGHVKLIVIQESIIHEGWQEIKYNLSSFTLPLTITDVYVAQDNENIRNQSFIYVDDLGYYTSKIMTDDSIKIPQDIKLEDQNNINIRTKKSYDIAFLDDIKDENVMLEWLKNKKLISDINSNAERVVFTGNKSSKFIDEYIEVPAYKIFASGDSGDIMEVSGDKESGELPEYLNRGKINKKTYQNKGYDILESDKVTLITMDISQNSIRKSDGSQFENLKNDIIDDETGNIIIVLNNTIDNFDDLKERRYFVDMLCELHRETYKKIYVVHDGYFNDFSMERGIKFLSINSQYNDLSEIPEYSYLIISIFGNEISYEYKRIF